MICLASASTFSEPSSFSSHGSSSSLAILDVFCLLYGPLYVLWIVVVVVIVIGNFGVFSLHIKVDVRVLYSVCTCTPPHGNAGAEYWILFTKFNFLRQTTNSLGMRAQFYNTKKKTPPMHLFWLFLIAISSSSSSSFIEGGTSTTLVFTQPYTHTHTHTQNVRFAVTAWTIVGSL